VVTIYKCRQPQLNREKVGHLSGGHIYRLCAFSILRPLINNSEMGKLKTALGWSHLYIVLAQGSDSVLIIKSCYLGRGFHLLILFWSTLGSVHTLRQGVHMINKLFH